MGGRLSLYLVRKVKDGNAWFWLTTHRPVFLLGYINLDVKFLAANVRCKALEYVSSETFSLTKPK